MQPSVGAGETFPGAPAPLLRTPFAEYLATLRPVALAWGLVGVFFLLLTLVDSLLSPHPLDPGTWGPLAYDAVWAMVAFAFLARVPVLRSAWDRRDLAPIRESTLVWGILGLLFGVVLGLLLLVAFLHATLRRPIFSSDPR
jgi:hypothetical protein